MTPEQAIAKETQLLLNRHNKTTYYKIKQINLSFPKEVLQILCQTKKRSPVQNKHINDFRKECLQILTLKSNEIKEQQLLKARATREQRLIKDPRYVKHFGVWINKTLPNAKISKEHYAIIDPKPSFPVWDCNPDIYVFKDPNDPSSVEYSSDHCIWRQTKCFENFDLNMSHYESLNYDEFSSFLSLYAKRRHFQEIFDLDDEITAANINPTSCAYYHEGYVYIMVLDNYKQVYIGITRASIKQRIKQHWNKSMPFDRLVFGDVSTSRLSINSFGPLDTTRVFALRYYCKDWIQLENYESRCIKAFDDRYILNRLR